MDGADKQYGQLCKPITAHPFKEAGLKGLTPRQPYYLAPCQLSQIQPGSDFHWPSLSELNVEIMPCPWSSDGEFRRYLANDSLATLPMMATAPPPKHAPSRDTLDHCYPLTICLHHPQHRPFIFCCTELDQMMAFSTGGIQGFDIAVSFVHAGQTVFI